MTHFPHAIAVAFAATLAAAPAAYAQTNPASEAAVRRMTDEALRGELSYDLMSEQLAQTVRPGEAGFLQMFQEMGAFQSIAFVETNANGADVFDVTHANGVVQWTVQIAPDGKTSNAFIRRFMDIRPQQAPSAIVQPAIDSVFAAFATHPVVALGDHHGLAQEMEFYADLIRDPRFAREVGNVVVEFGGASRQDVIDRYITGEDVPYTELRAVWTDVVGWTSTAGNLGFAKFFAAVREANRTLPADQRIKVWLGEPPVDWSDDSAGQFMQAVNRRDSHPADIVNALLAENKKTLVIYGGFHLGDGAMLRGRVEEANPDAVFVILPYSDIHRPAVCDPFLTRAEAIWPAPALAAPAAAGDDAAMHACATWTTGAAPVGNFVLRRPGADADAPPPAPPPSALPATVEADAILFLGPLETYVNAPGLPDYFLDTEYRLELARRATLGGPGLQPFPAGLSLLKADYESADLDAPGFAERIDAMFAEHDKNGDGAVTSDEYVDPVP